MRILLLLNVLIFLSNSAFATVTYAPKDSIESLIQKKTWYCYGDKETHFRLSPGEKENSLDLNIYAPPNEVTLEDSTPTHQFPGACTANGKKVRCETEEGTLTIDHWTEESNYFPVEDGINMPHFDTEGRFYGPFWGGLKSTVVRCSIHLGMDEVRPISKKWF